MNRTRTSADKAARWAAIKAGAMEYLSETPCRNGHPNPVRSLRGSCRECRRTRERNPPVPVVDIGIPIVTYDEARAQGLRYYFNGTPCHAGHISQRVTSGRYCCECKRLVNRERYSEIREGLAPIPPKPRVKAVESIAPWYASSSIRPLTPAEKMAGNARRVGR